MFLGKCRFSLTDLWTAVSRKIRIGKINPISNRVYSNIPRQVSLLLFNEWFLDNSNVWFPVKFESGYFNSIFKMISIIKVAYHFLCSVFTFSMCFFHSDAASTATTDQDTIFCLQTLSVICGEVAPNLRPCLEECLPQLCNLVAHRLKAVRSDHWSPQFLWAFSSWLSHSNDYYRDGYQIEYGIDFGVTQWRGVVQSSLA